jgi:hypothetical protein
MSHSIQQQLALVIVPKITGTVSILSSLFVMSEIINDFRKNDINPIKRALFGVTFFEIYGACGWFLTGLALPKGTDFVSAVGTIASCNFQGFLIQLIIGAPLFNGVLQYLFYLIVTGKQNMLQVESTEWKGYAIITTYTFLYAILPLVLKQYNPMSSLCWIAGFPAGCTESVLSIQKLQLFPTVVPQKFVLGMERFNNKHLRFATNFQRTDIIWYVFSCFIDRERSTSTSTQHVFSFKVLVRTCTQKLFFIFFEKRIFVS